jgi:lipoprotein signal peptidase
VKALVAALICLAIAAVLGLIVQGIRRSGVVNWGVAFSVERQQNPWLFQAGLVSHYVMIAIALGSAVWCLLQIPKG